MLGEVPQGPLTIVDGGLRYQVDLAGGQKTGFYLDQRENRKAAAAYFRDRRVLDMFCYSGGFALCRSRLGRRRATYWGSTPAAAPWPWPRPTPGSTAWRTCVSRRPTVSADGALRSAGEKFGGMVLDPPKFAHSRRSMEDALRAYHHLNRLGVELLEPGGILVTCSSIPATSRARTSSTCSWASPSKPAANCRSSSNAAPPRSSGGRHLPRDRVPQVLHLPGTQPRF